MGISGSKGGTSSAQSSEGFNQSFGSAMNLAQEQQYQNLWQNAGNLYAQNAGMQQGQAGMNQAQGYMNQGAGAFGTLQQMQNPGMDPRMGVYARQLGQQFNEQILPGMRGEAIMGGGIGGSRAGIGQGLAAARMGQQLQDFGAQLYGENQNRALQAAQLQGALGGQYAQQAMQNAQFGMNLPWYASQQMAGILGGPIMEDLGGMGSTSASGSSSGKTRGFGLNLF